jgi:integrase
MKLTQRIIAALALPEGKSERIVFDDTLPGFGVRLQGDSRRFIVQYKLGAKHRRMTLGSTSALGLDAARDSAKSILARVRLGEDTAGEKAEARIRAADICASAMKSYLLHQKARLRPRSYVGAEYALLTLWKPLHELLVTKIDKRTVAARLNEIATKNGPVAAQRARAILSAFFVWAMSEGLVEANPVIGTNRHGNDKARERVLTDDEIAHVWEEAGTDSYGTIVRLLILTGQRREEIGSLKWSEIDFAARMIRLPAERVKNARAHDVPLSEPAIALLRAMRRRLDRDFVFGSGANGFSGYSISKAVLDKRVAAANGSPLPSWHVHDLRRTCATGMAKIGVQPHIIEEVQNRASGYHKEGAAGIYNRYTYEPEKKAALDRWAEHVMPLVEGRELAVA